MFDRVVDPLVRRMLHPPPPVARPLPGALAARAEDVTVRASTLPIKAWLVRAEGRPAGTVALVHGWGHDGGRMAALATHVVTGGMNALLVDLPGHGRTGTVASYNVALMVDDLRAVRNWIASRNDPRSRLAAIVGFSFGGLGAYVAASRDARWAALVLIAAPIGTMEAARIYLDEKGLPGKWLNGMVRRALLRTFGVEPESFDAARNLGSIRVPVMIVHGEKDEVVPAWHAEGLEAAIPAGLATVVRVPGAGHSAVLDDAAVGGRVAGFLHEQLEKAGARA
jgi:pimeloyl-ACP methyl ester carboxylesterase